MELPIEDPETDYRYSVGPLVTMGSNLVPDAPIYEFMDSITGIECIQDEDLECFDGDVTNVDAFIMPYLLNDDAEGMESFIRTYIAHDQLTLEFERIKPQLVFYMWQQAILRDAWNVAMKILELSGYILPMINEEAFTDLAAIYRYFWSTTSRDMIDDVLVTIINYGDLEILLKNAMIYLDQYTSDVHLSSLNDADIDVKFTGIMDTNLQMAQIERDMADGVLKGDVGDLDLYESTQMPGDQYIRINPDRILDYLDEFITVIEKTYGSPYRSIFDLAGVAYDEHIFEDLRDAGVEFDPDRSLELLSPEQYHHIEELGEVYGFDSSTVELGGVLGSISSYPRI